LDRPASTKGPISDYVAAYRHIVNIFRSRGVTNVSWAWVPTGSLGGGNDARMLAGYPGDAYVDWVGYNPYNFFKCNGSGWKTFEQTIATGYNWFVSKGLGNKPFILTEYATQYDPNNPAASVKWNNDIATVLPRYPNLKAMVRFDADGILASSGGRCGMWIDNGPGMKAAWGASGRALGTSLVR
jgi:beta-mannanase